jgi:ATP-binding cassette subfamily C protein
MIGRAHSIGTRLSRTHVALMHETTQFLGGLKLAAGQNRQADFVNEFEASLAAVKRQQFAFIRQQNVSRRTATIVSGLTAAMIAFVGLTILDTPPPVLIAMLLVFARISGPVLQIGQSLQQFAHMLPAYADVRQLELDLAAAPVAQSGHGPANIAPGIAPGAVVFRDVSYRYDEARQSAGAVAGLSLTIEPGSFVGVTGPSGAGKTTFADLLIGLLEPQSGDITIGGTALRGPAAAAWRDHLSYVVQDPYLFRDTIRRNLLWASPQSSEAEIWDALVIAEADALVAGMADGLDTVLGERGTLISGGERQRLCLARAVLRRPWLFVLDEATSAIDVATERKILERFAVITPRPTVVIIAHRDESLAN